MAVSWPIYAISLDVVNYNILGNFHELRALTPKPGIASHADVFGVRGGFSIREDTTRDDGSATVGTARILRHVRSLQRRADLSSVIRQSFRA